MFHIQILNQEMIDEVYTLQKNSYEEYLHEEKEVMKNYIEISRGNSFVCIKDNVIIAYVIVYACSKANIPNLNSKQTLCESDDYFLHDMAINKEYQGFGISKLLMEHIVKHLQLNNAQTLSLVSVQNTKTFWENHGFLEVSNIPVPKYYGKNAFYLRKVF